MLNFLLDITPDKSQLLITIKLAGILREKKQEVYYTYTSNPAFTPVLYNKGISNCVLYPDDFRWLKPDLTLLDCRHAAHASLYRQLAIDYIFIAMQLPNQKYIQDKDISVLYLPPTPYLSSGSGPRVESLAKRLQDIKKDKGRNIIVWLVAILLLSSLMNHFSETAKKANYADLAFSEFMNEEENKRISEVTIAGANIEGKLTDGRNFYTYAPYDPTMVETLRKNGVKVEAQPEDTSSNTFWGIVISWFPMILLIGVWVYFMRQASSGNNKAMIFG